MAADALELPDASFDVVLCGFALMLLPDPPRAAAEFLRVLRPGGRCGVSVPTGAGRGWDFFGELVRSFAPRAERPIPPPPNLAFDAAAVLAGAGFDVGDVIDGEHNFVLPDRQAWWDWAWSQGMRRVLEAFSDDVLQELRHAAFEKLGSVEHADGLHLDQRFRVVVARRPS